MLCGLFIACGVLVSACGETQSRETASGTLVVTTSSVVEDIVEQISGGAVDVISLVPNGFDSHTYEPRPSELETMSGADLVILADNTLNAGLTQIVELSGVKDVLDLNATSLSQEDFITRTGSSRWNPHTWTDPVLVKKWVESIRDALTRIAPESASLIQENAGRYLEELDLLNDEIKEAVATLTIDRRKMVVYHDAWEYFGRSYGVKVVGALQARDFAEPSAGEIAAMAKQIREEAVPAFFGSEVFPSDVLLALEEASGARYIADLADDRLLGKPGSFDYGYIQLMRSNVTLLLDGLGS